MPYLWGEVGVGGFQLFQLESLSSCNTGYGPKLNLLRAPRQMLK